VFTDSELYDFVVETWPSGHGDADSLLKWVKAARIAFPTVDLLAEARKAALWESERPSNKKKSARRFLRNWWSRAGEWSAEKKAPEVVVPISAARWVRRHNRKPDFYFEKWVDGRGLQIDAESVREFCFYANASFPEDVEAVVSLLKGGE
tara:strand:+ start:806 stop:1255 length:450 start_codon:yes stop_codon:yes gene_type:complete